MGKYTYFTECSLRLSKQIIQICHIKADIGCLHQEHTKFWMWCSADVRTKNAKFWMWCSADKVSIYHFILLILFISSRFMVNQCSNAWIVTRFYKKITFLINKFEICHTVCTKNTKFWMWCSADKIDLQVSAPRTRKILDVMQCRQSVKILFHIVVFVHFITIYGQSNKVQCWNAWMVTIFYKKITFLINRKYVILSAVTSNCMTHLEQVSASTSL